MVRLDGGAFLLGSEDRWAYPDDGESPVREVELSPFAIEPCAVSNADFAEGLRLSFAPFQIFYSLLKATLFGTAIAFFCAFSLPPASAWRWPSIAVTDSTRFAMGKVKLPAPQ